MTGFTVSVRIEGATRSALKAFPTFAEAKWYAEHRVQRHFGPRDIIEIIDEDGKLRWTSARPQADPRFEG